MKPPRIRLLIIAIWVILDCLLSWSWVIIPGGPEIQRAWHAVIIALLVLAAWPVVWLVTRWTFPPAFCWFLSLPLAHASFMAVDWPRFALSAFDRPSQAWALSNVFIAGAFLMTAMSPRVYYVPVALALLLFGSLYSLLGPVQYWLCGPSTVLPLCHGYFAGHLPQFLTAIGAAVLVTLGIQVVRLTAIWK